MEGYKPRRLKIIEQGLVGYNGVFGITEFKDGVSVHPVGWHEAQNLGANVRVVDADDETYQVGPVSDYDRLRDTPADDVNVQAFDTKGVVTVDGEAKLAATEKFTREQLEAIADAKGLAGVRPIANALGKTGRSIEQCIFAILEAQGDNPAQSTIKGPGEDSK